MKGLGYFNAGIAAVIMSTFLYGAFDALSFPVLARLFPLMSAVAGFLLMLAEIYAMSRLRRDEPVSTSGDSEEVTDLPTLLDNIRHGLPFLGAVLAYFLAIFFFGMMAATALFVGAFLYFVARASAKVTLISAGFVVAWLVLITWAFSLRWPIGIVGPGVFEGF